MPPQESHTPSKDRDPKDAREPKEGREGKSHSRHHKERIGNYIIGSELGRGSFATVYKSYRSKTREVVAIKAVSRQKLTTKLLENLESEINILKAIHHRNIVKLDECFKNDTHIYLVMEYCSGQDLAMYLKRRGKLETLDFIPQGSMDGQKMYWPHPPTGGLDERITRSFVGQLAQALEFLRRQDLVHRDLKPQNLLLQPVTDAEVAAGHPYGVPVMKVADFGFARILPAAAMAETLCGSPLYMAPEILRFEKYDATADLWSVGAVLFEMAAGRPPFRASNHVELLRRIDKADDQIKFPDEASKPEWDPPPIPVPDDIKSLIRSLLKRHAKQRMSFEDFFASTVWDGYLAQSRSTEDDSLSLEASTSSSSGAMVTSGEASDRLRELVMSDAREQAQKPVPTHAPQPLATDPALNPQPARPRQEAESTPITVAAAAGPAPTRPPFALPVSHHPPPVPRRTLPKYYVQDDSPPPSAPPVSPTAVNPAQTRPRPIRPSPQRRLSPREPASVDEPQPITPSSNNAPPVLRVRNMSGGSPLAATPPITVGSTGKDDSALEAEDSITGKDYVVVEKRTVEINALADEVDQASRRPSAAVYRRPSTRTSIASRPFTSSRPSYAGPGQQQQPLSSSPGNNAVVPASYSPPLGMSVTPPFARPPAMSRQVSGGPISLSRPPSIQQNLNVFPPPQLYDAPPRLGSSPSSLQTGALARALTNTALRLIGHSANAATNAFAKATAGSLRRPSIVRTGEMDPEEDRLLTKVEELARKGFVLFELADSKLVAWHQLAASAASASSNAAHNRKSSSSSISSEVLILRQQERIAGEAVVLFCKALAFIVQGTNAIQRYWESKTTTVVYEASTELNELVQWLRARFNESYEKVEFAKSKCADELPFVDGLVHERARELSRQSALTEMQGDNKTAEAGYESALWLLQALLDDVMWDGGHIRDDDRVAVEHIIEQLKDRLVKVRRKLESSSSPVREVRAPTQIAA